MHKTVYVENNLNEWQKYAVLSAINDWEYATNGMVQLDVVYDATEEDELFGLDPRFSLIIKNTSADNPAIIAEDTKRTHNTKTLGLYISSALGTPTILLVDERLDKSLYLPLVEHEIGHALGLHHIDSVDSIMYGDIDLGPRHISNIDLKEFCKLYDCDVNKFKALLN